MNDFKFDTEDFTTTIKEAIQPELDVLEALLNKKKAIACKIEENTQELTKTDKEKNQIINVNSIIEDSLESHTNRMNTLADLESKRQATLIFSGKLAEAEDKCNRDLDPARENLIKMFRAAVGSYIIEARLPIIKFIESILIEDRICRDSILNLYNETCQATGIKQNQCEFGFDTIPSNLYPLPTQKAALKTMIQKAQNA